MKWTAWAALAALAGCGGTTDNGATAAQEVSTGVRAVAPAANPPSVAEVAAVETAGLLPPRAAILDQPPEGDGIAFGFRTPDGPDAVAGWYRSAGGRAFALQSELQEGAERVLSGTTHRPPGDFSVRLAEDGRGGTTAMVLVAPR